RRCSRRSRPERGQRARSLHHGSTRAALFCVPMVTADRQTLLETGLASTRARGRTAVRSCICRVTLGDRVTAEVPLGARPIAVGAGRECDLVLEDPQVSRRHAELALAPEGIRVRDLGSPTGNFWQGNPLPEPPVPFRPQIQIRPTYISF